MGNLLNIILYLIFILHLNNSLQENCGFWKILSVGGQKYKVFSGSGHPSIARITIKSSKVSYCSDNVLQPHKTNYATDLKKKSSIQITRRLKRNEGSGDVVFEASNIEYGDGASIRDVYVTVSVPTGNVYGFGEQYHEQLRHSFSNQRLSFFNRDHWPSPNINLYGFQPFYMGLDSQNMSYGVYFNTTYPMEANLTRINGKRYIKFHTLGGDIDFYVFLGPKPDQVIQQYTSIIGRPALPPYWSLGFHLCRYGYKNLAYLKKVWDRNRAAHIPQDVQIIDIDYMDHLFSFTYDKIRFKGLAQFIKDEIQASGRKLVLIQEPAVGINPTKPYLPLTLGKKMDIFIKNNDRSSDFEGNIWPGRAHWIDYTHPNASSYWSTLFETFHQELPFDGAWLDMNDPSVFPFINCTNNSINNPVHSVVPYKPLYHRTVCPDASQFIGPHLQWHNYYSYFQAKATYKALDKLMPGKRQFILSRSTSPGSGQFTSHWSGDNTADWNNLRQSIIALIEFNMFGIPFMGTDICGFGGNTNEELCLRWHQLGAFYTYARNHNNIASSVDQDPAAWPANTTEAIRISLQLRYMLLPYLNTLMFKANVEGSTVVRPLFFEFPSDPKTWNLYTQFLWGGHLMIVPILEAFKTQRSAYFPGEAIWYNLNDNLRPLKVLNEGVTENIHISKTEIGLFLRGGCVIPMQLPAENTELSRKNDFTIVVAFHAVPGGGDYASGDLFWDDGESSKSIANKQYCYFYFEAYQNSTYGWLTLNVSSKGCASMPKISQINVSCLRQRPKMVSSGKYTYFPDTKLLIVKHLSVAFQEALILHWSF